MDFINYLPSFYHNSGEVKNIQSTLNVETDLLKSYIADLLDQLFVSTATWGLSSWEKFLGLPIDETQRLDSRRSRVMTRLRGQGTTTAEMIKNVCSSFSGGDVEIIEDFDNYQITIKFVGTIGIPSNIDYLKSSLAETLPAHLGFSFEYTFNTQNDLRVFTHDQLKAYNHQQLKSMKIDKRSW